MKKAILVYNPNSGQSKILLEHLSKLTTKLLEHNILLTLYSISRKYDTLVQVMKNETFDILILSGGDGTLSQTLSKLYQNNILFPDIAIFPTGTSNDFAKCLNIGLDIDEWIKNVIKGKKISVDFGLIDGKEVFLSSYAGGLFTRISYSTDKALKKNWGKLAYYLTALTELSNIKKYKMNMIVEMNNKKQHIEDEVILFLILNGKGVAGFDEIISNADISDGLMHIMLIKNIDNPMDIPTIIKDLLNNNLINNQYVRTLRTSKCDIKEFIEDISISIDGEEGQNKDVTIEFISNKLHILKY